MILIKHEPICYRAFVLHVEHMDTRTGGISTDSERGEGDW